MPPKPVRYTRLAGGRKMKGRGLFDNLKNSRIDKLKLIGRGAIDGRTDVPMSMPRPSFHYGRKAPSQGLERPPAFKLQPRVLVGQGRGKSKSTRGGLV
jgi:hypothetical protein